VVVQESTGHILAGNHRWKAAGDAGLATVPVFYLDVDDDAARRILLVDNRSSDLAANRIPELAALLASLAESPRGLAGTGFDGDALDDLLVTLDPDAKGAPDKAGDPPREPITQPGDLILLGAHRLLCGDATDALAYERLLEPDGGRVDLVWTDPPYGVEYVGSDRSREPIENDGRDPDALRDLLAFSLALCLIHTKPGAAWYVAGPAGPQAQVFGQVLGDLGVWRQTLAWVKDTFVLGHSDFHYRHESLYVGQTPPPAEPGHPAAEEAKVYEPVYYGWNPEGTHEFHGSRRWDTVWECPKPSASKAHPTMKPLALIERSLRLSSRRGGVVLDPFAGSGSTLMACQETGRAARCIELMPGYCDAIVDRWEAHTGLTAQRLAAGTDPGPIGADAGRTAARNGNGRARPGRRPVKKGASNGR